jgi:hypothetical protein
MKKMFVCLALLIPMISLADGVVSPRTQKMIAKSIEEEISLRIAAIKEGRLELGASLFKDGRVQFELVMKDEESLVSQELEAGYEVLWKTEQGEYEAFWCPTFKDSNDSGGMFALGNPVLRFDYLARAILSDDECFSKLGEAIKEVLKHYLSQQNNS